MNDAKNEEDKGESAPGCEEETPLRPPKSPGRRKGKVR